MQKKYWTGMDIKDKDDFGIAITNEFVDGKTAKGPWAIMAPESFKIYGKGLGLGLGQQYRKQDDGRWLLING